MNNRDQREQKSERTVMVEEFKRDPAATTRRAMNEGPVAVVRGNKVLLVVSFPKAPALDPSV